MDFKNKIIAKYNAEVTPVFGDSSWDSFIAHRKKKKRRPLLLFFYSSIAGAILLGSLYLFFPSDEIINHLSSIPLITDNNDSNSDRDNNNESLLNTPAVRNGRSMVAENTLDKQLPATHVDKLIGTPEEKRPVPFSLNQSSHTLNASGTKPTNKIPVRDKDTEVQRKEPISQESNFSNTNQAKNQSGVAAASDKGIANAISPSEITQVSFKGMKMLPRKTPAIKYPENKLSYFLPIEIVRQGLLWQRTSKTIHVYSGLLFPFHVQTVEEQAHHFGAKIYFDLSKRLRLKTGTELARISFRSNMINPALGVESIETPSDIVTFNNAIVESIDLNWDLGLDALIFTRKNWQAYIGVSYLISTEIGKEIEYNFSGDDDSDDDDDLAVSVKDAKKYFVPHIIKFESGLQYQTKVGGLNLSIGYPHQLSKTKIELLGQLQLNIGFTRRF
ncbi:MAG: hypothetical protein HKN76_11550 [Saprospiraceae bacterium]|nr:hypothetical protein [Saprospiraceae bacterium]